ncbi:hypothetical protein FRB90_010437 [Tulasnella sp. 427]|nr:hypothetical protein FRB90_010437 [Tulasnella sp. 427]
MKPDPADDTNAPLLRLLTGDNTAIRSANNLPSATFAPSAGVLPVNVFFSLSLALAIISSLLAVLGQQWLVYYRKQSGGGPESQRWEQLRRHLGAKRWHMRAVLDLLPALLQLGLVIFCVAFATYLDSLSTTVYYTITGPMLLGAKFDAHQLARSPKGFGNDDGFFWKKYDDLAETLDNNMVKSLKTQLDGILIFAGLFAGVNSAFLALTLPQMSANPADDTNALLLALVTGRNDTIRSEQDLPSANFNPPRNGSYHIGEKAEEVKKVNDGSSCFGTWEPNVGG